MSNKSIGVVVIGRNEGARLRSCLSSIIETTSSVVYVDSGSSDDSVEFATGLDINVVNLDMSKPFTAARARNEGFKTLLEKYPEIKYVQFIDGDCEVISGWFESALSAFKKADSIAVVFGIRKERFPEASIYNYQADRDWRIQPGYTETCGGDALILVSAFNEMNGYDVNLIAGEEPDLCLRLRRSGWKILSISVDMTWHDSDLHSFYQWYKRAIRTGHAFADVAWKHRHYPEKYWFRHNVRIFGWGLFLPIFISLLSILNINFLSLFLIYPIQTARIAHHEGWLYALFCVLVKFPQAIGQFKFVINNLLGKRSTLIEYK